MNDENLERHLRELPAPELPAAWRAEILARACREARTTRLRAAWPPLLLWLRQMFAHNPITSSALATLWILILLFKTTTPSDPAAERMLLAHVDPSRPIYIVSLADQIRLAELLQDPPPRPPIP